MIDGDDNGDVLSKILRPHGLANVLSDSSDDSDMANTAVHGNSVLHRQKKRRKRQDVPLIDVGIAPIDFSDDSFDSVDSDIDDAFRLTRQRLSKELSHALKSSASSVTSPVKRKRRKWKKRTKLPYTSSMFYRDFHNVNVRDPTHIDGKEFRLDYRMPWITANELVCHVVAKGWVVVQPKSLPQHVGRVRTVCPPEIKVLATLYWLGEGCSFRTIRNLSGRVLSRQSFMSFAKKFCRGMASKPMMDKWIRMPKDVSELKEVSQEYAKKGFPGACGSVDGVQIPWEGCPFSYRTSFTGKESWPTLGFNVTVTHDMRIMHVCCMFAGRFNDKTKVLFDEYVSRLREGYYAGFEYTTLDASGRPSQCSTPYLICDNGYHKWVHLMCPLKTTTKEYLALWSKRLESLRKDVERTFGALKKRFKVLKIPLLFRDASFMKNIFLTCCVLHNMLLQRDTQFNEGGFRGVGNSVPADLRRFVLVNNVRRLLSGSDDFSYMEQGGIDPEEVTEIDNGFEALRKQLATHCYYLFLNRQLIR